MVKIHRNNEVGYRAGSRTKATMPETDITYRFQDPTFRPWAVQIHMFDTEIVRLR